MRVGTVIGTILIGSMAAFVAAREQQLPSPPFRPAVTAGDVVYVSGMLPVDATGALAGRDIRTQTTRTLDNLAALLQQHGSRLEQVASVTVYLKQQADFAAMNEVYARYWPKDPPVRTTVVADLVMPDALIEISLIALRNGVERRVVHPAGWVRSPSPYSYGIQSGNTLYLAGLVSRNGRDNTAVPGDTRAQTETVMKNAAEILSAAGMSFADVVSSRVYITNAAVFQDMNAAYRTAFSAAPPARATVRVDLTSPQYLVEITMTAVRDPRKAAITPPNADGSPAKPNPVLSAAIRAGDRLFLSGSLGATDANKGDAGAQTRETLARLGRTLTAAGFTWADVVESVVYLSDVRHVAAMNAAYREVFPSTPPARATVGTGLVVPDALVEIMLTAVKGGGR